MHPSGTDLAELATLIDQQQLEIVVDRIFPFAHIPDAFAYLEQGHARGKVVVQMVKQWRGGMHHPVYVSGGGF